MFHENNDREIWLVNNGAAHHPEGKISVKLLYGFESMQWFTSIMKIVKCKVCSANLIKIVYCRGLKKKKM